MGRSFYAFRAVLGLRTSWLSREAIAGLAYLSLAASYTALHWFDPGFGSGLTLVNGGLLALSALLFLLSSTMVYKATPRPLWRGQRTVIKFNTTAIIMGAATILLCTTVTAHTLGLSMAQMMQGFGGIVAGLLILTSLLKLIYEQRFLTHLQDNELTPFKRAAILMDRVYGYIGHIRLAAALFGGILLPVALLLNTSTAGAILIAGLLFMLTLLAEITERYLFFTCAVPSKMPGTPGGRK
jgi:DMSO reductase anchor subunit